VPDPSPIRLALATTLRDLRAAHGERLGAARGKIPQDDAAHLCQMHRNQYGKIERAESSPTIDSLEQLASGFNMTLSELFALVEQRLER
jgi:transcriptional regulator with XRE-family HTH domain